MIRLQFPRRWMWLTAGVVALAVLIIGVVCFFNKKDIVREGGEPIITYSTDTPDDSRENADNYNWRGGVEDPKKIIMPSIGVDSFIQQVGVDQNDEVAVPNNVHLAGWYVESARPGRQGLSIIDGHVNGRTAEGVFRNLEKLVKDDEVGIEFGNGEIKNFKVIETHRAKVDEAASILFSQKPKVYSQLNLITCVGEFDRETRRYQERLIVYTELIQ
ncbi:class F sortase [Candidatus Saccharibacteria bacterium]|nr:class F sortase [Candidatus Saccharibacteria bacterium]